jgi:hypothetical protein
VEVYSGAKTSRCQLAASQDQSKRRCLCGPKGNTAEQGGMVLSYRKKRCVCSIVPLLVLLSLAAVNAGGKGFGPRECAFRSASPRQYVAHRALDAPTIDGDLREQIWQEVRWTEPFVDIFDRPQPRFETRVKIR